MSIHASRAARAVGDQVLRMRRTILSIGLMALPTISHAFVWGSGSWGGSVWGGGGPVAVPALPVWGLLALVVAVGLAPRLRSRNKLSTRLKLLDRRKP